MGDSPPADGNCMTRRAGRLRRGGWDQPRPHSPYSQSQETALTTHAQKRLRGGDAFWVKSILVKRRVCAYARILRYATYGLGTRQIKMIGQRKPRRSTPIQVIETATRARLRTLPLSLPMCLSTRTAPLFPLINTLLVSLLSVFAGIIFCKAEGPGPCH